MKPFARTRIKICGLTRSQDVDAAVRLGADALGFVFYPPSKRCLTPDQAAALVSCVPPFVTTVALFVDPSAALVNSVLTVMRPTCLQFHGDESLSACEQYNWPYIKAFRVGAPGMNSSAGLAKSCQRYGSAAGWLFDSYTPAYGGSGHGFERSLLSDVMSIAQPRPLILSGGLKADTVGKLIRQVQPWAVDVSSGVESAPGEKSPQALQDFMAVVRQADEDRCRL